jgi:uncharacterized protein YjbJ (UPF0337 family)
MNKDQVRGVAKIVAGKVQEEAGNLLDSPELFVKGVTRQVAGKAQKGRGDVRKTIEDFTKDHPRLDRISDRVRGKTIRFSWTEGPAKGTTQEHVFHDNGTVEWHSVGNAESIMPGRPKGGGKANAAPERPAYTGIAVTEDVCMISYLSKSGYTLTVVLNFEDASTVAIASNATTRVPARGSFEVMS